MGVCDRDLDVTSSHKTRTKPTNTIFFLENVLFRSFVRSLFNLVVWYVVVFINHSITGKNNLDDYKKKTS